MLAAELTSAGVVAGQPLALVIAPAGVAVAWASGSSAAATDAPASVIFELAGLALRWTVWSARDIAPLVGAGLGPARCWDLGAVARLVYGGRRSDPAAVWAAHRQLAEPPAPEAGQLPDLDGAGGPVRDDGQLSREWAAGGWAADLDRARRWAELALSVRDRQEAALRRLPDPRPAAAQPPLALLTAYAESAAALLAVELEGEGLPLDGEIAAGLLRRLIGARPADAVAEGAQRHARDAAVLRLFPGRPLDLRSPQQVRALLARIGLDLPDTRSWRLEPHAATSPAVAGLLAWRKAERTATTYGWGWLERHAGGGRLRGAWTAADAAAGRMTAGAGLHNLPAELRPAIRAEPGMLFVRADLGQVEPRVLAVVSGDPDLGLAAGQDDMYAPVARNLRCDRATAKVAVLAAMYGAVSGPAAAALRDMDRAYPRAMAYLRAAEEAGRTGTDLRTYGGRLLRLRPPAEGAAGGAGRFARNAVVQGAAAELFKVWAGTVRAGLAGSAGRIVLCLHDELLLHVPRERAAAAAELLVAALAATSRWWAAGSGVRFVTEVRIGTDWAASR